MTRGPLIETRTEPISNKGCVVNGSFFGVCAVFQRNNPNLTILPQWAKSRMITASFDYFI